MRTATAAVGSAVFFLAAPVVVAALVPWLITGWDWPEVAGWYVPVQVIGVVLIVAGAAVVIDSFVRFVREGHGTPAPVAAPDELVVGGLYRFVRNPMYVGVVGALLGQAMLLADLWLLAYAAGAWLVTTAFVMVYEEPELRRRFGTDYDAYRHGVGRWIPRLTPWRPGT